MENLKLLCSFTRKRYVNSTIDLIIDEFDSVRKLFVFYNRDSIGDYYITFNIDLNIDPEFRNFITIHRKKESNTLYSVNALNMIIQNLNNGILDKTFKLDWSKYKDVLLLTKNGNINRIPLILEEVINIDE